MHVSPHCDLNKCPRMDRPGWLQTTARGGGYRLANPIVALTPCSHSRNTCWLLWKNQGASMSVNLKTYRHFAFCALFCLPLLLQAQSQTAGAIGGTVTDPTGAVIPSATVQARDEATNAVSTTKPIPMGDLPLSIFSRDAMR